MFPGHYNLDSSLAVHIFLTTRGICQSIADVTKKATEKIVVKKTKERQVR